MTHLALTTRRRHPLTEIELCAWLGQAAPGDVLEYHRGFLALDVAAVPLDPDTEARAELRRVAKRALWAFEQDLVHLVQRRHGPSDFAYLAIARQKPRHAAVSLAELLLKEAA